MVKKKPKLKSAGAKIHNQKARLSRRSRANERQKRVFRISRRVVLIVIALAMLAVALALLISTFSNPKSLVTSKIESIIADYYENYFYPRIENNGTTKKSLAEILSRYTETGFSRVTLRQLLLFDSERYADSTTFLTKYCDPESTYVKIYPDEPFGKSNYHVDYHYTCTF